MRKISKYGPCLIALLIMVGLSFQECNNKPLPTDVVKMYDDSINHYYMQIVKDSDLKKVKNGEYHYHYNKMMYFNRLKCDTLKARALYNNKN